MNMRRATFWQDRRRVLIVIVVLLIAIIVAVVIPLSLFRAHSSPGSDVDSDQNVQPQSFSLGANASLIIKEQGGNVSVFPSKTGNVTVTPRKHQTTLAPDPHAVNILYDRTLNAQGNDQLMVSTDPWFSNTDFYVTIPTTTTVQITVKDGSIDIHSGHGATVNTSNGSIALENIEGPVSAHTESGDVTADNITGSLAISSSSGSLRMNQIKGSVEAKTFSGDVVARDTSLSGNTLLQTQNGSVRFDGSLAANGSYRMQTTSGDVDLTLPADTAFALDATTGSGTVQNAFGSSSVGNTPRPPLSLHTQNGSINIVKGLSAMREAVPPSYFSASLLFKQIHKRFRIFNARLLMNLAEMRQKRDWHFRCSGAIIEKSVARCAIIIDKGRYLLMQETPRGLVVEAASTINAPLEHVWSVLTDFARYGEWNTFVPSMQATLQVGSPLTMSVQMRKGLRVKISATVSLIETHHRLAWTPRMPAWFLKSERFQVITALDAHTTRYWTQEIFTGAASPLLTLLLSKDLRRGFMNVARDLKARAEASTNLAL